MDCELKDRVVLITGAAGGIGMAVADGLAAEGCDIVLVDSAPAHEMAQVVCAVQLRGRNALAFSADVRDCAQARDICNKAVEHFGRLDALVCCAGITRDAVGWKMSEPDWDDVIDVNLKGCFNYARAAIPALRAADGGRVVFITSINGLRGKFGQSNYAAAKAGVIGLGKTLAREVGKFGVTVNMIAPGLVDTPMTRVLPAEVRDTAVKESLLGRISNPRDVADAVVFLCSARARQITGEVLRVDAGQYV